MNERADLHDYLTLEGREAQGLFRPLHVANRKCENTAATVRGGSGIPARRDISRSGERDAAPESNRLLNEAGRPSRLTAGWLVGRLLVDSSAGAILARPVGTTTTTRTRFKLESPRAARGVRLFGTIVSHSRDRPIRLARIISEVTRCEAYRATSVFSDFLRPDALQRRSRSADLSFIEARRDPRARISLFQIYRSRTSLIHVRDRPCALR